ncbi:MAG: hypothetical protein ACRD8U_23540 [Pyrinomonadaceae bacterium]
MERPESLAVGNRMPFFDGFPTAGAVGYEDAARSRGLVEWCCLT